MSISCVNVSHAGRGGEGGGYLRPIWSFDLFHRTVSSSPRRTHARTHVPHRAEPMGDETPTCMPPPPPRPRPRPRPPKFPRRRSVVHVDDTHPLGMLAPATTGVKWAAQPIATRYRWLPMAVRLAACHGYIDFRAPGPQQPQQPKTAPPLPPAEHAAAFMLVEVGFARLAAEEDAPPAKRPCHTQRRRGRRQDE